MNENRTLNSAKNVSTSMVTQILSKIFNFIVRTAFIYFLNTEYLGVNGLFTNVLSVLSFAEMGIGTAIIYKMYEPIVENDKEKIKSLMQLYKKSYIAIGIIVFVLGLLFIPFMGFIIKEAPVIDESLTIIYLLFLTNTSISYFFTFKKSIIIANQKQSVINKIDSIIFFLKCLLEVIILYITRYYIAYLIIEIIFTFIENFYISKLSEKMYPFLKERNIKKLSKNETKSIITNVKSLVVYKFGNIVMNSTDNMLISSLINISTVGICSNYSLIISSVKSVMQSSLNSITSSIGNMNVTASSSKKEEIYYQYTFIYYLISSFVTIAFVVLLNPFIKMWIGESYLLSFNISLVLSINFYIDCLMQPGYIYRTTLGMFEKSKKTPYIGAISNILLSIVLCKVFGLIGIFMATGISLLISYVWIDPYLLHKYVFHSSMKKYIITYIKYFGIFIIEMLISIYLSGFVNSSSIIVMLLFKTIIVLIVPNFVNIALFYKSKEFLSIYERLVKNLLKKEKLDNKN